MFLPLRSLPAAPPGGKWGELKTQVRSKVQSVFTGRLIKTESPEKAPAPPRAGFTIIHAFWLLNQSGNRFPLLPSLDAWRPRRGICIRDNPLPLEAQNFKQNDLRKCRIHLQTTTFQVRKQKSRDVIAQGHRVTKWPQQVRIASFLWWWREGLKGPTDAVPGAVPSRTEYTRMQAWPGAEGSNLPAFITDLQTGVHTSKTDSVVHLLSLLVFHKMHIHFLYK